MLDLSPKAVVIEIGGRLTGLLVDRVIHVVRLHPEDIEPPPAGVGGAQAEFVAGIGRPPGIFMPGTGGRMLIILNLDAVLAFEVTGAAPHAGAVAR